MNKGLNKDIRIMPYLPIFAFAGIYGLGIVVFMLLSIFPLNKKLEYLVYIIFGFTKEIMPLHKLFGLFDNYFFLGQWPTATGLILDIFAIFIIISILNFLFLRLFRSMKKVER